MNLTKDFPFSFPKMCQLEDVVIRSMLFTGKADLRRLMNYDSCNCAAICQPLGSVSKIPVMLHIEWFPLPKDTECTDHSRATATWCAEGLTDLSGYFLDNIMQNQQVIMQ